MVSRLLSTFGEDREIGQCIRYIITGTRPLRKLRIKFPIFLNNTDYVRLYSLMASEGSNNTEFNLHVPEKEFHTLFRDSITALFGRDFGKAITVKKSKGFLRSRAPRILRYLVPVPLHIPKLIVEDKEFSREYLKIAFEAEGSPIISGKSKRYIKLTRNVDVSIMLSGKIDYPAEKRIYFGQLKRDYPFLANEIIAKPPSILLGEYLLLKHHFNITSKMVPEAIRINKTGLRFGKITARWVLTIYANNIDKFIQEIGFITKRKQSITKKMLEIPSRHPKFFAFSIMQRVQRGNIFCTKEFINEMKKEGYVDPKAFLSEYLNFGLLERIERGKYKINSSPQV